MTTLLEGGTTTDNLDTNDDEHVIPYDTTLQARLKAEFMARQTGTSRNLTDHPAASRPAIMRKVSSKPSKPSSIKAARANRRRSATVTDNTHTNRTTNHLKEAHMPTTRKPSTSAKVTTRKSAPAKVSTEFVVEFAERIDPKSKGGVRFNCKPDSAMRAVYIEQDVIAKLGNPAADELEIVIRRKA